MTCRSASVVISKWCCHTSLNKRIIQTKPIHPHISQYCDTNWNKSHNWKLTSIIRTDFLAIVNIKTKNWTTWFLFKSSCHNMYFYFLAFSFSSQSLFFRDLIYIFQIQYMLIMCFPKIIIQYCIIKYIFYVECVYIYMYKSISTTESLIYECFVVVETILEFSCSAKYLCFGLVSLMT